jgi:hypothetical protein
VIEQQGGIRVSDDTMNRLGSLLEQLGARFDLVLEAVTGFGGRLDKLQSEMVGQFAEVGRQVRFISDRIAENREANAATRSDLGAEMIRLGEMLGATRVELRDQLGSIRSELKESATTSAARIRDEIAQEFAKQSLEGNVQLKTHMIAANDELRKDLTLARNEIGIGLPAMAEAVREEISASTDTLVKKLDSELKQTGKALTTLTRKFERFDDRMTVQSRDQDQRLRKLERRTASK